MGGDDWSFLDEECAKLEKKGGKKGAKDSKGTKQAGGKQAKMAIMRKGKHTHVAKKDHVCTMSDTRVTSHSL